jgi:ubiquinone/menaquinone biosynthesis C-methylase UbiE
MRHPPTLSRFSTWYDGFLYEKLIAPQSERLQTFLTVFAKKGGTALEVGCGVGALSFKLAAKCSKVVGVDISQRMISYAERKKLKLGVTNVEFVCADAAYLANLFPQGFDTATLVLFLHEVDAAIRRRVVESLLSLAERLIIADFSSPFPRSVSAHWLSMQEFIAGRRHYHNFKNWMNNGGVDGFVSELNLTVRKIVPWENQTGKVVIIAP